jgi:PAS domain S-box-containing protein
MRFTPYVLPLLLSAVVTIAIGLYTRRHCHVPGVMPFVAAMFACALWALGYALDISSDSLTGKYWSEYIRFPAAALLPLAWFLMAVQYTGRGSWVTRARFAAMLAIPGLTCAAVWTSRHHSLFRELLSLDASGPFPVASYVNGPWYWVHQAWVYLLIILTMALLLASLRGSHRNRRAQTLLIAAGLSIPLATDVLFQLGITPVRGFNPSSSMMLPASFLLFWALARYGLWRVGTIGRGAVLEQTRDIMLVLDREDRLVDMNRAAESALGAAAASTLGRRYTLALGRWPELLSRVEGGSTSADVDRIDPAGTRESYHLSVTPLEDRDRRPLGRLLFLRDISERVRAEAELRESEERFRMMADALPTAILLTRKADAVVLYINPEATKVFKVSAAAAAGRVALDFYQEPSDRLSMFAQLESEGFAPGRELLLKRGSGEPFWAILTAVETVFRGETVVLASINDISEHKRLEAERDRLSSGLREAMGKVRQLSGLLPICASCKKIRDDRGYWQQIEAYVRDHSEAEFSHSICPDCARKLYPQYAPDLSREPGRA